MMMLLLLLLLLLFFSLATPVVQFREREMQ
jgi:hypothetical protein